VAESARAGLREVDRLEAAARKGGALIADLDVRSRLPDGLDAALRTPALTPRMLAQRLCITPQAATRLLASESASIYTSRTSVRNAVCMYSYRYSDIGEWM
jgi:hypothetical protein